MASTSIPSTSSSPRECSSRRWFNFGACSLVVAVVWLLILPAFSNTPSLQREIADRRAKQIDASAMFYTDLELMDDVLARLNHYHRTHPAALWKPEASELPPAER